MLLYKLATSGVQWPALAAKCEKGYSGTRKRMTKMINDKGPLPYEGRLQHSSPELRKNAPEKDRDCDI